MIKCANCNTEHPEYFTKCPKCNLDRLSSPPKNISPETTNQISAYDNSLNIFDCSFKNFTAPRLLKIAYVPVLAITTIALVIGILTISQFPSITPSLKFFFSLLATIGYIYSIILTRITFELCLVLFKIERNTRR